ncbi:DUF4432 family protein [Butyrivibrio sp. MC2013]|uniref:DUF4432 family protein n=1 Tax=Butyrivibrio sp. MC2013 TaxID=1280686 RepID=UPI00040F4A45|nr:DUF4432 family protein [Butyrivibrio sp. MC2013]
MKIITHTDGDKSLHEYQLGNRVMSFTVIPERGMDIGDIYYREEKISWDKDRSSLKHPDNVDLKADGGWNSGFYCAVSSLGPEVFGTPDEVRTPHGTGAYSMADISGIRFTEDGEKAEIFGALYIKGYEEKPSYYKEVTVTAPKGRSYIVRTECFTNLTDERIPFDAGFHIQLCGRSFMEEGGSYLLPVRDDRMLLRDSAPSEKDKKEIYPANAICSPIRCYQYIPEEVEGIFELEEMEGLKELLGDNKHFTIECVVNKAMDKAAFIIRPLEELPRSLMCKCAEGTAMYAIEPCMTRPNSIRQKEIDGELRWLEGGEKGLIHLAVGFVEGKDKVGYLKKIIEKAY